MKKIEEIARAIWAEAHASEHPSDPTWETWPKTGREASLAYADYSKEDFFRFARAAIEAMREPGEAAINSGVQYRLHTVIGGPNNWVKDTEMLWKNMIYAILNEKDDPQK